MTSKTFSTNHTRTKYEFYIQSRGNHSGRPLHSPIPNCFVISLKSEAEKEQYFNLVQALFESGQFKQYIFGSVIPLIRIGDFKKVITLGVEIMKTKPIAFEKTHKTVSALDLLIENAQEKIELMKRLKSAHLHQFFRGE
jgi:hypothetical protein